METLQAPHEKTPARWQPLVALVCFAGFIVGFGALHVLRQDLDPRVNFGSEYALGREGWIMGLNFVLFGAGLLVLGDGLLRTPWARRRFSQVGIGFLLLAGTSFFVSIFFPTDPLGAPATPSGTIHATFGLIVFLSIPVGAMVLTAALWPEERWRSSRWPLATLAIASLAAFLVFPPLAASGLAGLGQRIALSAYLPWLITCAAHLRHIAAPELSVPAGAAAHEVA